MQIKSPTTLRERDGRFEWTGLILKDLEKGPQRKAIGMNVLRYLKHFFSVSA
jgi:hypothetical protein